MKKYSCHDCNAKEGEYHLEGCDMERCVKCNEQLISCSCRRKQYGKEPYIIKPLICARCGMLWPNFFMVSDKDWKKTIGVTYDTEDILCKKCYNHIRKLRKIEP